MKSGFIGGYNEILGSKTYHNQMHNDIKLFMYNIW